MLSNVKDVLTSEMNVKGVLTKEVNVKEFLEMEIELTKLKKLLATEVKLKEFLVQEIDLGALLSAHSSKNSVKKQQKEAKPADKTEVTSEVEETDNTKQTEKVLDLPAYDYALVDTLTAEHKKIRYIFNQIMSFTIEKEYTKVAGQLDVFNKEIREHYQKADTELYAYIKTYVQIKYPKREKAFTQLSLEMKNLSIEIYFIMSQSVHIPLTEKSYNGFLKDFMAIGKLLNERISREQNVLFKMYQQTHTAKSISE